jgi:transposase
MSNELKKYLEKNASRYLLNDLVILLYMEFNIKYDVEYLRKYLNYHKISYKKVIKRQFNQQQKDYLMKISKNYTPRELMNIVNEKFNQDYTLKEFHSYLRKNKIPFKYEDIKRAHIKAPLYSEGMRKGQVIIKISERKWVEKQRYIYEQYHNVKLKPRQYVVFIDGDRENFDINNLKVVDCKIAGYIGNYELRSKNKQISELGFKVAELMSKTKDIEKGL